MKNYALILLMITVLIGGCATAGRNYQPDLDTLNSKVSTLQSQLDGKNREIANMQDQIRALGTQLELANRAKAEAESRLYQALDKLASKTSSASSAGSSASKTVTKSESYIK